MNPKTSALIIALTLSPSALAAFDFDDYPLCAQAILYQTAPQNCDYGDTSSSTTAQEDECLCADVDWMHSVASEVYKNCTCEDLLSTAAQMNSYCLGYAGYMALDQDQFVAAGAGDADCSLHGSGSVSDSASESSSSASSSSSQTGKKSNAIALGIGLGIVLPSLIVGLVMLWLKLRKRPKKSASPELIPLQPSRFSMNGFSIFKIDRLTRSRG